MNCIYGQVTKLPQGFWSATFYDETDAANHANADADAAKAHEAVADATFDAKKAQADAATAGSADVVAADKAAKAVQKVEAANATAEAADAAVAAKKPLGAIKVDIDAVRQPGQTDDEAVEAFHTIEDLFDTVHAAIKEVRKRLVTKQRKIDLAAPSATEIQNALQGSKDAEDGAERGASRLKEQLVNAAEVDPEKKVDGQMRLYDGMSPAKAKQKQKVLRAAAALPKAYFVTALKMPAELTTCTKLIGD